jgi:glycosyltransferase involved in cell wall biosynthesis
LLENYRQKDDRIRIISQENRGLSAARNAGLREAKGDYILFLDSDDYLDEYALSSLYDLATSKSLDLIMFKMINFDNVNYEKSEMAYFEMDYLKNMVGGNIFNWKQVKNRIFDISVTAPGKFFRHDLISRFDFPEGVIFEDNVFFIKVIFKAKRIYFYDEYLYNRRIREDSITNSYHDRFSDCIIVFDLIKDYLKQIGKYREFSEQLFNRKCRDVFFRFSLVREEYKQDFFEKIKENFSRDKNVLEKDGILKICSERSLEIFNSALSCETYREFELSINVFDLKRDKDRLKLNYDMLERSYQKKFHELTKEKERYQDEIDVLKNSTSWKVTKMFRVFIAYIKKIVDFFIQP